MVSSNVPACYEAGSFCDRLMFELNDSLITVSGWKKIEEIVFGESFTIQVASWPPQTNTILHALEIFLLIRGYQIDGDEEETRNGNRVIEVSFVLEQPNGTARGKAITTFDEAEMMVDVVIELRQNKSCEPCV